MDGIVFTSDIMHLCIISLILAKRGKLEMTSAASVMKNLVASSEKNFLSPLSTMFHQYIPKFLRSNFSGKIYIMMVMCFGCFGCFVCDFVDGDFVVGCCVEKEACVWDKL